METNASPTVRGVHSPRYISLDRALPVNAACQACRSKHQRCDGTLPICLRCKKGNRSCNYAPSRRGRSVAHLHSRKTQSEVNTPASDSILEYLGQQKSPLKSLPSKDGGDSARIPPVIETCSTPTLDLGPDFDMPDHYDLESLVVAPLKEYPYLRSHVEELVSLDPIYTSILYSSIWPPHPFLPPRICLEEHVSGSEGITLIPVINYIGSIYARARNSEVKPLAPPQQPEEHPRNGFTVQSLILLAISSHMSNSPTQAQAFLHTAIEIALAIGLHRNDFSTNYGKGSHAIEESWRRTWWELYILDIMFAGLNQTGNMRLKDVNTDVLLPCEEAMYNNSDTRPRERSLAGFDRRFFAEEEVEYSSFSYRIAAARALSGIIPISIAQSLEALPPHIEAELVLENLILHLPKQVQSYANKDGSINEVLFQTHMMIHVSKIYLHRPRSMLAASGLIHQITCAPDTANLHSESILHHTKKTVDAADGICQMISAPSSLFSRTPFFVCAVALQAIVHISAFSLAEWSHRRSLMRQQIQMSIGALKKLSELWEMAKVVFRQVKSVAKAVLDPPRDMNFPDDKQDYTSAYHSLEDGGTEGLLSVNLTDFAQGDDDTWFDDFLGQN